MRLLTLLALASLAVAKPTANRFSEMCRAIVDNVGLAHDQPAYFTVAVFPAAKAMCASVGIELRSSHGLDDSLKKDLPPKDITYEVCLEGFSNMPASRVRSVCNEFKRDAYANSCRVIIDNIPLIKEDSDAFVTAVVPSFKEFCPAVDFDDALRAKLSAEFRKQIDHSDGSRVFTYVQCLARRPYDYSSHCDGFHKL